MPTSNAAAATTARIGPKIETNKIIVEDIAVLAANQAATYPHKLPVKAVLAAVAPAFAPAFLIAAIESNAFAAADFTVAAASPIFAAFKA